MSDYMAAFAPNIAQPRSLTEALRPQSPPPPPNQPQPSQPYTPPAEQPADPLQANASQQQADRPQRDDNPAPAGDDFRDVLEKRLSAQSDEQKPQTDKRKADPKDADTKGVALAATIVAEAEVHQNISARNAKLAIVGAKSKKTPNETAAGLVKNAQKNVQANAETVAKASTETAAKPNANESAMSIASEAAAAEKTKDAKPEKTAPVEKSTAPDQLNLKNPAVAITKNAEGSTVQNKQVQIVKQTANDTSQQPKTNNAAAEVIKNTTTDHPGRIHHRPAPTEQTDNQALQQVKQADDVEKVVSNETILNQTDAKVAPQDPAAVEPELTMPENKTGQSTQQFDQDRNRQILDKAIEDVIEVRLSQAIGQSATNAANPAAVVKNATTAISATDAARNTSPASATDPISRAAANENAISPAKQIADRIAADPPRPEQEITITLNPEELGRIKISFQQIGGEITGILKVEKPETRYDIERQLPQIAAALQDSGVNVKRINVVTNNQQDQQNQQNHKNNSPNEFDEPNPHHFGDAPRQNSDNAARSSNEIPSDADYPGPQHRENVATDDTINVYV